MATHEINEKMKNTKKKQEALIKSVIVAKTDIMNDKDDLIRSYNNQNLVLSQENKELRDFVAQMKVNLQSKSVDINNKFNLIQEQDQLIKKYIQQNSALANANKNFYIQNTKAKETIDQMEDYINRQTELIGEKNGIISTKNELIEEYQEENIAIQQEYKEQQEHANITHNDQLKVIEGLNNLINAQKEVILNQNRLISGENHNDAYEPETKENMALYRNMSLSNSENNIIRQ